MDFLHGFVVTGSIGCGKSSFCTLVKKKGFDIIDADEIAHEQLQVASDEVVKLFGKNILKDGTINRVALGGIVFGDAEAKKKLEGLLHPMIKSKILSVASELEKCEKPYFVDIPLYYETANYDAKNVIVVYAPRSVQLERLTKQKNMTINDANARINSQIDIEKKRQMADIVIDNSGSVDSLEAQTIEFIKGLQK